MINTYKNIQRKKDAKICVKQMNTKKIPNTVKTERNDRN